MALVLSLLIGVLRNWFVFNILKIIDLCFQLVNSLVSWENFFVFWYMKLVLCLVLLGYHRKIFKSGEVIKAITAFYLQVKPQGQSSLFICSAVTHDAIDIQFVT